MNPSNPTTLDIQEVEQLFFRQMRERTRRVTNPVLRARLEQNALHSFDFQFSDRWVRA